MNYSFNKLFMSDNSYLEKNDGVRKYKRNFFIFLYLGLELKNPEL